MEYMLINRDTLNQIVEKYITNLPKAKQKKALINNKLLTQIKAILLNPKDTSFCQGPGLKKKFILEEIVPEDYRIFIKATNNSVPIVERYSISYPWCGYSIQRSETNIDVNLKKW
ncbi:22325_t:CDS:1 [Gigaspora rosea]|nr:22325_t:CDS:1 [Gigaspora rosea]